MLTPRAYTCTSPGKTHADSREKKYQQFLFITRLIVYNLFTQSRGKLASYPFVNKKNKLLSVFQRKKMELSRYYIS
jgi:hypothetical protein